MKKRLTVLVLIAVVLIVSVTAFAGCNKKADYVIAVLDDYPHFATTMAHKGFINKLDALMEEAGKTVSYKYSKSYAIESIPEDKDKVKSPEEVKAAKEAENVKKYVDKNVNMFLALSKSSAQAIEAGAGEIPSIYTSVGIVAQGLTADDIKVQVERQVDVMQMIAPGSQKFGIIYFDENFEEGKINSIGYTNAKLQADTAKSIMEARGIEVQVATYQKDKYGERTEDNLIKDKLEEFKADGVGCVFIPVDNNIANVALSAKVYSKSNAETKLPIVCGDVNMNSNCGVATYGIDYYAMGERAAEIAFDILVNGNKRDGMVTLDTDFSKGIYSVNYKAAKAWDVTIPTELETLITLQ